MSAKINKVFVYGTLLQGETLCHYMNDCKLLQTLEIPGSLYDTNMGYPTAIFDQKSDRKILGELYLMERPGIKLSELDKLEMTESAQYNRIRLNYGGQEFFAYEAGVNLQQYCCTIHQIETGNWRSYSSQCFSNPVGFAIAFEDRQKYLYRDPVSSDADGSIYLRGETPIMVSAPHASVHERMDKPKRQEFYTAALSAMLHSLTGCHSLYTNRVMKSDPNYYDGSPYKKKLAEIIKSNNIKFLLDLHGTGPERDHDCYPGTGISNEFLLSHVEYYKELEHCAELHQISLGGLDVFPAAKQMTVTKYAARILRVPAMQLEINRKLREPEKNTEDFIKLNKFLRDFVNRLSNLIS